MPSLPKINPHCAGIDVGSESVFIGIEDCDIASFATFTDDYLTAIAYLKEHYITAVAMEATGVYWITLFDMLEAAGIAVTLVNGKQVKYLPGRKTDVADCQWTQQLHSFGLLRPCFIPDDLTRQLRTYTRLRVDHLSMASSHIQQMHKVLTLMNIRLQNVISHPTVAEKSSITRTGAHSCVMSSINSHSFTERFCFERLSNSFHMSALAPSNAVFP
jgi:transposase